MYTFAYTFALWLFMESRKGLFLLRPHPFSDFSPEQLFPHLDYIIVSSGFHLWFSYQNRTVSISRTYGFHIKNVKVCLLKQRYGLHAKQNIPYCTRKSKCPYDTHRFIDSVFRNYSCVTSTSGNEMERTTCIQ